MLVGVGVPERLHRLVGLCTGVIIRAPDHSLIVLIEGQDQVQEIPSRLIAELQGVVVTPGHVPIQCAEDAFIIVREWLAPQLGKQAVAEAELSPSLVEDEAPVAVDLRILPPDAYMLRGEAHLKLAALIAQREACSIGNEPSRQFSPITRKECPVTIFGSRPNLHVYRRLIVARLCHHSAYEQRKDHTKHSSSHCLVLHCLINGCKGRGYSVHWPSYLLRRRARTLP